MALYAAALLPLLAILVIGLPPVSHPQTGGRGELTPPWLSPAAWRHGGNATILGLQIALYLAAATLFLALFLAILRREPEGPGVKAVLASGSSIH